MTEILTSSVWKVRQVTIDEADETDSFVDMTLKFSGNGFTSTGGSPVWPASGTWQFTNDSTTEFIRDDGVTVTIEHYSSSDLQLSLYWDQNTLGSGRKRSVQGRHVFYFEK